MELEKIVDDSGDAMGYLTKGHVDKEIMLAEIHKQFDDSFVPNIWEQTVMRKIPTPWHEDWAFIFEYSEPGHGAFKCTVAWAQFW